MHTARCLGYRHGTGDKNSMRQHQQQHERPTSRGTLLCAPPADKTTQHPATCVTTTHHPSRPLAAPRPQALASERAAARAVEEAGQEAARLQLEAAHAAAADTRRDLHSAQQVRWGGVGGGGHVQL